MKIVAIIIVMVFLGSVQSPAQNDPANKTVFVELLGNGITYSFNYDTRFSNRPDGFGGRAGIGYISVDGVNLTSIPFVANYLLGKNGKYFEIGAGATFIAVSDRTNTNASNNPINSASGWTGTMSFGYRSQPVDGGFLFRAGITPIFTGELFFPFWPQISFGYAF